MTLTLAGPRIAVRPDVAPTETPSGLVLLPDRPISTTAGTVVAVGTGPRIAQEAAQHALDALWDEIAGLADVDLDVELERRVASVKARFTAAPSVHPGDRVIFSPVAGDELLFEHDLLVVLREDDVLAVIQ